MAGAKIIMNLLKAEVMEKRRALAWFGGASVVVLFMFLSNRFASGQTGEGTQGFVLFWFSVIGFYLATEAFSELKRPQTAQQYLLIPARTSEKVAAKVIAYTIGWLIIFTLCWLVAAIAAIILVTALNSAVSFTVIVAQLTGIFVVFARYWYFLLFMQSLAVFASVYFRRQALLKLIIAFGLFGLVVFMVATAEIIALYHGWAGMQLSPAPLAQKYFNGMADGLLSGGLRVAAYVVHIMAIPFLWLMTWLRLRETEAL